MIIFDSVQLESMREIDLIKNWIKPESRILDLGCGSGEVLYQLKETLNVSGYGLEIDPDKITECIRKGINVIEQDLNLGLKNFPDQSLDSIIMLQTLQAVQAPDFLIQEMVRISREAIVTFPSFSHWRCRLQVGLLGKMPVSKAVPHQWYDTPNIHLCTFKDFEMLCRRLRIEIMDRSVINSQHKSSFITRLLPNLFGEVALYRIRAAK